MSRFGKNRFGMCPVRTPRSDTPSPGLERPGCWREFGKNLSAAIAYGQNIETKTFTPGALEHGRTLPLRDDRLAWVWVARSDVTRVRPVPAIGNIPARPRGPALECLARSGPRNLGGPRWKLCADRNSAHTRLRRGLGLHCTGLGRLLEMLDQ